MNARRWALAGAAGAVTYTATVILGGIVTPGYNHVSDHVSALLQAGSQETLLLAPLFLAYNLLTIAMGFAIATIAREVGRARGRLGALGGYALVAEGLAGAATLGFPQDPIGATATATGIAHIALAGVSSLLTMVAMALIGAWYLASPGRTYLARYSFVTLVVTLVSGAATAIATANLFPLMGLYERFAIFGFIQWLLVISLAEARMGRSGERKALELRHAQPQA